MREIALADYRAGDVLITPQGQPVSGDWWRPYTHLSALLDLNYRLVRPEQRP